MTVEIPTWLLHMIAGDLVTIVILYGLAFYQLGRFR